MWAQIDQVLQRAATQIIDQVAGFLPGVLVALLLVVATFVVALLVHALLTRALRGVAFDQLMERWGVAALFGWSSSKGLSQMCARVAYWTIVVLGLLVSLTAINATIPSQLAIAVFEYVPHLLAAMVILVVGALTARFLARSVLIGAVNMQIANARMLSLVVKWMVLLVAVAMALEHIGIGRDVLLLAFGLLFGGAVFAVALAVGLGAKDAIARAIDRQLREPRRSDGPVEHV